MESKILVSVVIITKNEEIDLKNALESVKNFSEIIIVDAFSTDKTLEIATQYGATIYQHEWPGFAQQKQRGIDYATNRWVLILDADERVTPSLANEIATAINDDAYQGYYLPRKNFFLGCWIQYSGLSKDFTLRLFKKAVSHMEHREVHEKVIVQGNTRQLTQFIEHYSHSNLEDYLTKTHHYAELSAIEMEKKGINCTHSKLIVKPFYAFIKLYFLKQGFRDGIRGFILAFLFSYSTFLKYAKLWEKQNGKNS